MAYKQKINPRTGKFDLVGGSQITSKDNSINIESSGNEIDLSAKPRVYLVDDEAGSYESNPASVKFFTEANCFIVIDKDGVEHTIGLGRFGDDFGDDFEHGFTQVQSDWEETDETSPAFILNKPDIPDTGDFVDKVTEQYINAVKHFGKAPCIKKESADDSYAGIWLDDYQNNHLGYFAVSGTNLSNSKPIFGNQTFGYSEIILKTGIQTITGDKTFRNASSYQVAVSTDDGSSSINEPSIGFMAKGTSAYELVGRIGVQKTGYAAGYPAFWTGPNATAQKLVRVSETGDQSHGIYIDQNGFTKKCKLGGSPIHTMFPLNGNVPVYGLKDGSTLRIHLTSVPYPLNLIYWNTVLSPDVCVVGATLDLLVTTDVTIDGANLQISVNGDASGHVDTQYSLPTMTKHNVYLFGITVESLYENGNIKTFTVEASTVDYPI